MRQKLITGFLFFLTNAALSQTQTNTFPPSGSVGIGILGPEYSIDVNKETRPARSPAQIHSPAQRYWF